MLVKCPFGKHLQSLQIDIVSNEKTVKTIADFCPNLKQLVINNYKIESNAFKRIANQCQKLEYLSLNELSYKEQFEQALQVDQDDQAALAAAAAANQQEPVPPKVRIPIDESVRIIANSHSNLKHMMLYNCHLSATSIKMLLTQKSAGGLNDTKKATLGH